MSDNQGIPNTAEEHLLILVSSFRYQYPLPQPLPCCPDTPRSSSGAMTAKGTQLTNKVVFPSHFLHKSLYQPSCSPQTEGISVRFAVAEQIERCTTTHANAIHEGCRSWRWGHVYRNPWQHRHPSVRASVDAPKKPGKVEGNSGWCCTETPDLPWEPSQDRSQSSLRERLAPSPCAKVCNFQSPPTVFPRRLVAWQLL